jgi:hypothetical protein
MNYETAVATSENFFMATSKTERQGKIRIFITHIGEEEF